MMIDIILAILLYVVYFLGGVVLVVIAGGKILEMIPARSIDIAKAVWLVIFAMSTVLGAFAIVGWKLIERLFS